MVFASLLLVAVLVVGFVWLFWRSKYTRSRVWLVDDREENRNNFKQKHQGFFEIETFESTDQVLRAIEEGRKPDALLCDIYFIEDPERREEVELLVRKQVEELKANLPELRPDEASGIELIADVREHFNESPHFPIYAYTSKGPYLLHGDEFDRLENLDARWLFKGKYAAHAERHRIITDIRRFRDRFNWPKRLWQVALTTGLVGAILGVILDRILRHFSL